MMAQMLAQMAALNQNILTVQNQIASLDSRTAAVEANLGEINAANDSLSSV